MLRSHTWFSAGCAWTLLSLAAAAPAAAQDPPQPPAADLQLRWQPDWPKVRTIEFVASGAAAATAYVFVFAVDPPRSGGQQGFLVDDLARDLFRSRSRAGRERAATISDFGYRAMLLYPWLDAGIAAWAVHGAPEVAGQMFALDFEVFALAGLVSIATERTIGRARPSQSPCLRDPGYEDGCNAEDRFGSFASSHAILAAASAGVTCAHHLNLPLYGGGNADAAACVGAAAVALTTGITRIMADRHWTSDVIAGWVLGGLIGYGLPQLLHYGGSAAPASSSRNQPRMRLIPGVTPTGISGTLWGTL